MWIRKVVSYSSYKFRALSFFWPPFWAFCCAASPSCLCCIWFLNSFFLTSHASACWRISPFPFFSLWFFTNFIILAKTIIKYIFLYSAFSYQNFYCLYATSASIKYKVKKRRRSPLRCLYIIGMCIINNFNTLLRSFLSG